MCAGSGAALQDVHEGDEASEPLSLAMKAGRRSQSVPADIEEPEPLSMALKPGRSLPPEPAPLEDNEPEPLSMSIKAGQRIAQPPPQDWSDEEPEPLSMAMKAGRPPLQPQEALPVSDDREPLSMAMKAGRPLQPQEAVPASDDREPLSMAMKAGRPLQPQEAVPASDDREPLSMAIRSGRRTSASAAADVRESAATRVASGGHQQQAIQDSAADMHAEESPFSMAAKARGPVSAMEEDSEPQPLVMRAKPGRRLHVMMGADMKATHMAAGGTAPAPEEAADSDAAHNSVECSNSEREVEAGAAQPAATELIAPDTASSTAAPGKVPCIALSLPNECLLHGH